MVWIGVRLCDPYPGDRATTSIRQFVPLRRHSRFSRARLCRASGRDTGQIANNYAQRIRGDRGDNLEKAIAAYQAALTVFTREAMPDEWARSQYSLGHTYQNRIRGNQSDNLEKAIAAHLAALTVFTREALPSEWALAQYNLGTPIRTASAATEPTTWKKR